MQDKDFLGYFGRLELISTKSDQENIAAIKQSSTNIINTLLALTTKVGRKRSESQDSKGEKEDKKEKKKGADRTAAMMQKYSTGDLGKDMTPDLNYTIKRLVRGLTSDTSSTKKGFFFASVQVYARFAQQINCFKLLQHVVKLTKTSKTNMKNPEINALNMGQMLTLSAVVESGLCLQIQNQHDTLMLLGKQLVTIYEECQYLRESVKMILEKLLVKAKGASSAPQLMKLIVKDLHIDADNNRIKMSHPDHVSMMLSL
jgi:hypothetical protein